VALGRLAVEPGEHQYPAVELDEALGRDPKAGERLEALGGCIPMTASRFPPGIAPL
jgi:hypothetical protein